MASNFHVVLLNQAKAHYEQVVAELNVQIKSLRTERDLLKADYEKRLDQSQKEVAKEKEYKVQLQTELHSLANQLRSLKMGKESEKLESEKALDSAQKEISKERNLRLRSDAETAQIKDQFEIFKSESQQEKSSFEKKLSLATSELGNEKAARAAAESTIRGLNEELRALRVEKNLEKTELEGRVRESQSEALFERELRKETQIKAEKVQLDLENRLQSLDRMYCSSQAQIQALSQELASNVGELNRSKASHDQTLMELKNQNEIRQHVESERNALDQQLRQVITEKAEQKAELERLFHQACAETSTERELRKSHELKSEKTIFEQEGKIQGLEQILSQCQNKLMALEQELANSVVENNRTRSLGEQLGAELGAVKELKVRLENEVRILADQLVVQKNSAALEKSDLETKLQSVYAELAQERETRRDESLRNEEICAEQAAKIHGLESALVAGRERMAAMEQEAGNSIMELNQAKSRFAESIAESNLQLKISRTEYQYEKAELEKRLSKLAEDAQKERELKQQLESETVRLKEEISKLEKQRSTVEGEMRSLEEMVLNYQNQIFAHEKELLRFAEVDASRVQLEEIVARQVQDLDNLRFLTSCDSKKLLKQEEVKSSVFEIESTKFDSGGQPNPIGTS